jgi:hypothetical protein
MFRPPLCGLLKTAVIVDNEPAKLPEQSKLECKGKEYKR